MWLLLNSRCTSNNCYKRNSQTSTSEKCRQSFTRDLSVSRHSHRAKGLIPADVLILASIHATQTLPISVFPPSSFFQLLCLLRVEQQKEKKEKRRKKKKGKVLRFSPDAKRACARIFLLSLFSPSPPTPAPPRRWWGKTSLGLVRSKEHDRNCVTISPLSSSCCCCYCYFTGL